MRKNIGYLVLVLALLFGCTKRESYELKVTNPLDVARQNELIVLSRMSLETKTGKIERGKEINIYNNKSLVPTQLDDMNGDGEWDEMAFMVDLKPNETKNLQIVVEDSINKEPIPNRTNIRFAEILNEGEQYKEAKEATRIKGTDTKYTSQFLQMEGPAWENDKIAFRNYFDERNGMDIFGKVTENMVLDEVGIGESYHEMGDWGMDILKVGTSLGAGALALQYNDSLIRVTTPHENAHYKLITEGPLRSVFDLTFDEIQVGENTMSLTHRVTIQAGKYGYNSYVSMSNKPENASLVTGIVNLQSDTSYFETVNDAAILYTHAQQSYNNEMLGMGIVTSQNNYKTQVETPDEGDGITSSYCMVMQPEDNIEFNFYAGWEKSDPDFAQRENFNNYLKQEALLMNNPVTVDY